jgi:tetratricopeptide (TPR) repeat protein
MRLTKRFTARMIWNFGFIVLALATFAQMAQAEDFSACYDADNDVGIRGCTAIIDHNTASQSELAKVYYNRGVAYDNKEQHDRAIKDYDKAITLNPKYAEVYNNRGIAYTKKGKADRAIVDFDKAIALNSKFANAFYHRGIAYDDKGEYDRAVPDYVRAAALDPQYAEAYLFHFSDYFKMGQNGRSSMTDYTPLDIYPGAAGGYYNRGIAYKEKGQYDRAIKNFDKAITLNPKYEPSYFNRGISYEKLGKLRQAKLNYQKTLELLPKNKEVIAKLQALGAIPEDKAPAADKSNAAKKPSEPAVNANPVKAIANTDISGSLIAKQATPDAKTCAAQCSSDVTCAAWTWNVWNAMCFTKSSADEILYEPSSVSGMANGKSFPAKSSLPMTMVRYRGKGFDVSKAKGTTQASFEDCEASCKASKNCAVFTWLREGDNACYLIPRATAAYETDKQFDSGVKRQVAQ